MATRAPGRRTSLFRQNLMLFVILIAFGQVSAAVLFFHFSQRPRIDAFASIAARQIVAMRSTLNALDAPNRKLVIERFNASGTLMVSQLPPPGEPVRSLGVPGLVLRKLQQALEPEGMAVTLLGAPQSRIVAHWSDPSGDYYATLPELPLAAGSPAAWLSLSILIGLLSLGGALLIERHLHRPLDQLVAAARQLGQGETPQKLAEDGPREIAIVAQGFNRMVEDLARIDQERAVMLAGVSHDLRTPLTKMRLALGILEGQIEEQLAEQMIRGVEDMDRLIEQFLDFARAGSDEAVTDVDLPEMIKASLVSSGLTDAMARQDVPAALVLRGRANMLRRLFDNVFDNAIKYGRPSASEPLSVRLAPEGAEVLFECLDHGPGFEPDAVARLKRPFVRGDGSHMPGTGLGLAIVARIVAVHRGRLELERRDQGGARVAIRLPLLP